MKTKLCRHNDNDACVWCISTEEPTLEEVMNAMGEEFIREEEQ